MKPIRVILNPAAGHGNGARLLPSIEAALTRHALEYDLVRTEHPGTCHRVDRPGNPGWRGTDRGGGRGWNPERSGERVDALQAEPAAP